MTKLVSLAFALLFAIAAQAQFQVSGHITNENHQPIEDAIVIIDNQKQLTDQNGFYLFETISEGEHLIQIQKTNYAPLKQQISVRKNITLNFELIEDFIELETSLIRHKHGNQIQNETKVSANQIIDNYKGSLAQSLENISGIQAMNIGAQTSKPIIRGLGFNRIAVTENGIKQEGQQWGADHGLEISPWNVEQVQILKGASTLEFGSDAMGGVVALDNSSKPLLNSFSGSINLFGATNNQLIGGNLNVQQRTQDWYYKFKASYSDFGDYQIPTDQIKYLNRNIPIENNRLKNTAGQEYNLSTTMGFVGSSFENVLNLSYYHQKLGFFPGAHGIPDLDRVKDDGNRRNVEFPYQNVQHIKIANESILKLGLNKLNFRLGYQNNHRQEWSLFHTHYGNLQVPNEENSNLELDFNLSTYDAQAKFDWKLAHRNQISFGFQTQFQQNKIAGYSFLLPQFEKSNYAAFVISDWNLSTQFKMNLGARWDWTNLHVSSFFDDVLYEFMLINGHSDANAQNVAQRSLALDKHYSNFNAALGLLYQFNDSWDLQLNLGSNFRIPTAIELASNGIHHGSFRHERGNPNLNPERGWTSDLKLTFHPNSWQIEINPYFYYFQNYIFLEPSGNFSPLPHAGQIYQFTQSKALITGIDVQIHAEITSKFNTNWAFEYLYNQLIQDQQTKAYPLPFSPPLSIYGEIQYKLIENHSFVEFLEVQLNSKLVSTQNRIAKNEASTEGYNLFGIGIKSQFNFKQFQPQIQFRVDNLFDTKYYNHMSFYRALEIPEMGRNIKLILTIPIQ